MKKLSVLFIISLLIISSTCFANVGDKVGDYYSTDIKAYINDIPVSAYNIGGRTCVAIEDVTMGYAYNDDFRILLVTSFDKDLLKEDASIPSKNDIGKIMGSIYSTDIKSIFYNKELPSYNIGGKTCVAIEDIGNDREFSDIGGRYFWNPDERTIKLEYLYDTNNVYDIQLKYKYGIDIKDGIVTFVEDIVSPAWISTSFLGMYDNYDERKDNVIPLYYIDDNNEVLIGYNFASDAKYFIYSDDGKEVNVEEMLYSFNYFYKDVIEEMMSKKGVPQPERTNAISQLMDRLLADIIDRHDTDDYSFLYLRQPTPHGQNDVLIYMKNDGSYEVVSKDVPHSIYNTLRFTSVYIDKDNETVNIMVQGDENIYVFDMKNGIFLDL